MVVGWLPPAGPPPERLPSTETPSEPPDDPPSEPPAELLLEPPSVLPSELSLALPPPSVPPPRTPLMAMMEDASMGSVTVTSVIQLPPSTPEAPARSERVSAGMPAGSTVPVSVL